MSANPRDVGLSHGQTRIGQTELPHQSVRLALFPNLTKSLLTTIPLFCCKVRSEQERSVACAIDLLPQVAGVYAFTET